MDSSVHSFLVRIWIEETADEAVEVLWRGRITHVASKKRASVTDLDQVIEFIVPYLREMGGRKKKPPDCHLNGNGHAT